MTYSVQALDKPRADLPGHGQGQERALPDRHRLPDRPRPPDGDPALALRGAARADEGLPASTSASTRTSTATAAAGPRTPAPTAAPSPARRSHAADRLGPGDRDNAANRDYAQPVFSRSTPTTASRRSPTATRAPPATGSSSSTPAAGSRPTYTDAAPGNLVQTARVDLGHDGTFTLALGFGATPGRRRSAPPGARCASRCG